MKKVWEINDECLFLRIFLDCYVILIEEVCDVINFVVNFNLVMVVLFVFIF